MLPWWIIVYWHKGPAITVHNRTTGKIIFTLLEWKINEFLIK